MVVIVVVAVTVLLVMFVYSMFFLCEILRERAEGQMGGRVVFIVNPLDSAMAEALPGFLPTDTQSCG